MQHHTPISCTLLTTEWAWWTGEPCDKNNWRHTNFVNLEIVAIDYYAMVMMIQVNLYFCWEARLLHPAMRDCCSVTLFNSLSLLRKEPKMLLSLHLAMISRCAGCTIFWQYVFSVLLLTLWLPHKIFRNCLLIFSDPRLIFQKRHLSYILSHCLTLLYF